MHYNKIEMHRLLLYESSNAIMTLCKIENIEWGVDILEVCSTIGRIYNYARARIYKGLK